MSTQGFPDWQTSVPALGASIANAAGFVATSFDVHGPYYVGGYEDTIMRFVPLNAAGGFIVDVWYYTEQARVNAVSHVQFTTFTAADARQKFANVGPWLYVTVQAVGAAVGQTYLLTLQPRKAMSGSDASLLAGPINYYSFSLAAGATSTNKLSSVFARQVNVAWDTDATNFALRLDLISSTGTVIGQPFSVDQVTVAPKDSRLISLPMSTTNLVVTNNDGVLRNFKVTLVPTF